MKNPFNFPQDDFYRRSIEHEFNNGLIRLSRYRTTVPSGNTHAIGFSIVDTPSLFRSFRLSVASGDKVSESKVQFFKDSVYSGGNQETLYNLNLSKTPILFADEILLFSDVAVTSNGNQVLPDMDIDVDKKAVGIVSASASFFLEKNTSYMVLFSNLSNATTDYMVEMVFSYEDE